MAGDATVSTGEIARLGGVGRAAVSNWRRRHKDFPAPVAGTAANPRFALVDVEAWLRRNGRPYRLSPADRAWQHLRPDGDDLYVASRLAAAGEFLLAEYDPASLERLPGRPGQLRIDRPLRQALSEMTVAMGPGAAFEEICARFRRRQDPTDELAAAMAQIAMPSTGTLLDPACGTGALLLAAAPRLALGQAGDPVVARIAAARLLLAGIECELLASDALLAPGFPGRPVDAVVCNAPGDKARGHAALAGDPRFVHGLPPRNEPELAWLQHSLDAVRPDGMVVVRMPHAAASRRSGRRIRASLLRSGALRAVITVPEGDLWVLRAAADDTGSARSLLLGRVPPERAAPLWEEFTAGAATPRGGVVVPVLDLLDDDVDLSPDRHLPRADGTDPGHAFSTLLGSGTEQVPALQALPERRALPTATVTELTRAGALRLRHAPARLALGSGSVAVLTAADLAVGTTPTARTTSGPALVRIRPGDVVAAAMGRVRVASTKAVLGPGMTVYRVDPERLDPDFLAGVLRAAPAVGNGSSRYGRVRVPLMEMTEQRAYGAAFRELQATADVARAAATRAEQLQQLGEEGLVTGWLRPG
ncbi:N-6 DNA methylase [Actinomycetes bacterium KLBMP 9759]